MTLEKRQGTSNRRFVQGRMMGKTARKASSKAFPSATMQNGDAFIVSRGVLRANTDLYWEFLEEFDDACNRLLECRAHKVEVDLRNVNFISSSFVGCLGNLVLEASRKKRRVVMRVSEDVSWLFEILNGQDQQVMEMVVT